MNKVRIILHVDLNAFFVRVEEILNPELKGKPVAIGHLGRAGIVSTCSYEARKYGVRSGMPTFEAVKLCPNLILIQGHYEEYRKYSDQFFAFLERYSHLIEKASIDECYVDMTEQMKNIKDPVKYLRGLQRKLYDETKLTCSIGVAPTKFLAKMASDMEKPNGLVIIRRKEVAEKIYHLPIESFYGIGRKTSPELRKRGISTIGDLAKKIDDEDIEIKNLLGKFYYVISLWIHGYGSDEVDIKPFDPKSIGNSTTLMHDTNDLEEIKTVIADLSKEVSDRAKKADKIGDSVQITLKDAIRTDDFKSITRSKKLDFKTNDFNIIFRTACSLLEKNLGDRIIRLVGVTLQNLISKEDEVVQLSLFDDFEKVKEENATKLLVQELNRKMNGRVFRTLREKMEDDKYEHK